MSNDKSKQLQSLREDILSLVREYGALKESKNIFIVGETPVPPSGKLLDENEYINLVDASLDGWLTTGRFNDAFESKLADILHVRHALTTNSGSSANLLAFASLTSPRLGDRALKPGDEVITVAAGFPTTVNPIIQYGCIPVFVDIELGTYNIDPKQIEAAVTSKTKAIMLAHTLGNPFDINAVLAIVKKYDLWLIEDSCDALGAQYTVNIDYAKSRNDLISAGESRAVGSFGHIGTLSFYPAHHITMGEGGAVFTNSKQLNTIAESFRDWGRDCYCPPGQDNSCSKRFEWQLGSLPKGYDHKYIYSHCGFNLKITDMQAACGLAQLEKLDAFVKQRNANFAFMLDGLQSTQQHFILPYSSKEATPSWFGFPITVISDKFTRLELVQYLDKKKIGTRQLFSGNIVRQPYMQDVEYRQVGDLEATDKAMADTIWLGVQPALGHVELTYVVQTIKQFIDSKN